jgi:glycosyltransferase involved in cell wall biosynthesis
MKIVQITTDNRDHFKEHHLDKPWFGTAPEALLQGFALLPEHEVHVVSCTRKAMRSPEKLADNIWFHSVCISKWGMMRSLYAEAVLALRSKIKEINPDIVHGQGTERECALAAVFSGYPNVVTIHGNMGEIFRLFGSSSPYYFIASQLEKVALKNTDKVFCNSAYTEELVGRYTKKTARVSNPIREEFFSPIIEKNSNHPIILNIGVISRRKRQIEILNCVSKLWDKGYDFKVHFVGKGGENSDYFLKFKEMLQSDQCKGRVFYHEALDSSMLVDLMDRSSALIHFPSEEAFGLVAPEAMARRLKLFCSATGGLKDIAQGVDSAELFDVDGWDNLEAALAKWLKLGAQRPSANLTELMRRRYHPLVIAKKHVEIYREVLSGKAKA